MRVIAGAARGRKLKPPQSNHIRPTADRVKESLFSILASRLTSFAELRVLDLCAGTGNLGIEALSRGAQSAVFVDSNREAIALIRYNLELVRLQAAGTVLEMTASRALQRLGQNAGQQFDLVFLDPPYSQDTPAEILPLLDKLGLVSSSAVVVVEQDSKRALADTYGSLALLDQRIYGATALYFYAPVQPPTNQPEG